MNAIAIVGLIFTALNPVSPLPPLQDTFPDCGSLVPVWSETAGGGTADFLRLAEVVGRAQLQPRYLTRASSFQVQAVCPDVPWRRWLLPALAQTGRQWSVQPIELNSIVNSGYPADRNNGALWAGKGLSTEIVAGARGRWGVFSAAVAPRLIYQQNQDFIVSAFALARGQRQRSIDWPSRHGNRPYVLIDPGQSYVRADAYGIGIGFATENFWLGPGLNSSIMLSNTAPGFPHLFVGTSRPVDVHLGDLDVQSFWGRLDDSEFYEPRPAFDDRLFAGVVLSLAPHWLPGLSLAASRVMVQNIPVDGLSAGSYFAHLRFDLTAESHPDATEERTDQIIGLSGRWVLPASDFEVFAEWTRNDRSADLYDFIVEPDHGRAYMLGFQKVVDRGGNWYRLAGELFNVENSLSRLHRRHGGGYYEHNFVRQGYTHRGQLLGGWTGPGSSSQVLMVDAFSGWGSIGIFGERARRDTDFYFSTENLRLGFPLKMDVELGTGLRGNVFLDQFGLGWGIAVHRRTNRDFLPPDPDELSDGYRTDYNWSATMNVSWRPHADL